MATPASPGRPTFLDTDDIVSSISSALKSDQPDYERVIADVWALNRNILSKSEAGIPVIDLTKAQAFIERLDQIRVDQFIARNDGRDQLRARLSVALRNLLSSIYSQRELAASFLAQKAAGSMSEAIQPGDSPEAISLYNKVVAVLQTISRSNPSETQPTMGYGNDIPPELLQLLTQETGESALDVDKTDGPPSKDYPADRPPDPPAQIADGSATEMSKGEGRAEEGAESPSNIPVPSEASQTGENADDQFSASHPAAASAADNPEQQRQSDELPQPQVATAVTAPAAPVGAPSPSNTSVEPGPQSEQPQTKPVATQRSRTTRAQRREARTATQGKPLEPPLQGASGISEAGATAVNATAAPTPVASTTEATAAGTGAEEVLYATTESRLGSGDAKDDRDRNDPASRSIIADEQSQPPPLEIGGPSTTPPEQQLPEQQPDGGFGTEQESGLASTQPTGTEPWQESGQESGQETRQEMGQETAQEPMEVPQEESGHESGQESDQQAGKKSGQETVQEPLHELGQDREQELGKEVAQESAQESGKESEQEPEQELGQEPGQQPGQQPEQPAEQPPEQQPDQQAGKGSCQESVQEAKLEPRQELEPGAKQELGKEVAQESAQGSGKESGQGPEQESGQVSGQEPEHKPDQQPEVPPDEQPEQPQEKTLPGTPTDQPSGSSLGQQPPKHPTAHQHGQETGPTPQSQPDTSKSHPNLLLEGEQPPPQLVDTAAAKAVAGAPLGVAEDYYAPKGDVQQEVMEGETKAKRVREETSPSPLRGEEATSAAAAREPLGVAEDYYLPRNGNEQQEKIVPEAKEAESLRPAGSSPSMVAHGDGNDQDHLELLLQGKTAPASFLSPPTVRPSSGSTSSQEDTTAGICGDEVGSEKDSSAAPLSPYDSTRAHAADNGQREREGGSTPVTRCPDRNATEDSVGGGAEGADQRSSHVLGAMVDDTAAAAAAAVKDTVPGVVTGVLPVLPAVAPLSSLSQPSNADIEQTASTNLPLGMDDAVSATAAPVSGVLDTVTGVVGGSLPTLPVTASLATLTHSAPVGVAPAVPASAAPLSGLLGTVTGALGNNFPAVAPVASARAAASSNSAQQQRLEEEERHRLTRLLRRDRAGQVMIFGEKRENVEPTEDAPVHPVRSAQGQQCRPPHPDRLLRAAAATAAADARSGGGSGTSPVSATSPSQAQPPPPSPSLAQQAAPTGPVAMELPVSMAEESILSSREHDGSGGRRRGYGSRHTMVQHSERPRPPPAVPQQQQPPQPLRQEQRVTSTSGVRPPRRPKPPRTGKQHYAAGGGAQSGGGSTDREIEAHREELEQRRERAREKAWQIHEARARGERKYDYPPQPLSKYRPENPVPAGDRPDVLLDVPNVSVDEISLDVRNVRAHIALEAKIAKLVNLQVGVDASIDDVNLSILGVKAQALLVVRLHNVRKIVDKVLSSIVQNPRLINRLFGTVDNVVRNVDEIVDTTLQPGGVLEQTVDTLGRTIRKTVDKAGNIVEKVVAGPGEAPPPLPHPTAQQRPHHAQSGRQQTIQGQQQHQHLPQPAPRATGQVPAASVHSVPPQMAGLKEGGQPLEGQEEQYSNDDEYSDGTESYASESDSYSTQYTDDSADDAYSDIAWEDEATYPLKLEGDYEEELAGWDRPREPVGQGQHGERGEGGQQQSGKGTVSGKG